MGSPNAVTETQSVGRGVREVRRLETRGRLFNAALAEIARHGLAAADVASIAASAGVVRGTFYFHFPTKEHVLIELERDEEARIVGEMGAAQHLGPVFGVALLVRHVLDAQRHLGAVVFRDMLGFHFSSSRPVEDELVQHPARRVSGRSDQSRTTRGRVPSDADAAELGTFFLTGLFALLATGVRGDAALLDAVLDVATIVQGMETR